MRKKHKNHQVQMGLYCGMGVGAIECPVHTKLHFQWSIDKTTGIPYIMDDSDKFEWDNNHWCQLKV